MGDISLTSITGRTHHMRVSVCVFVSVSVSVPSRTVRSQLLFIRILRQYTL